MKKDPIPTESEPQPVVCSECEMQVGLYVDVYSGSGYVVQCGCNVGEIGVDRSLAGNSLVDPVSGRWEDIDSEPLDSYRLLNNPKKSEDNS